MARLRPWLGALTLTSALLPGTPALSDDPVPELGRSIREQAKTIGKTPQGKQKFRPGALANASRRELEELRRARALRIFVAARPLEDEGIAADSRIGVAARHHILVLESYRCDPRGGGSVSKNFLYGVYMGPSDEKLAFQAG